MLLIQKFILPITFFLSLIASTISSANEVPPKDSLFTDIQSQSKLINNMTLAVEDSWPPYANAYGEGISTDIVKTALESVGVNLNLKVYPYAQLLEEIHKGLIAGGYNVTRQKSREKKFLFGNEPILNATASFYFPINNKKSKNYKSIYDIPDGSTVGVITDYEYGDIYEKQKHRFKEIKVAQQNQIINMLKRERIDAAIMFDAVADSTLNSMELSKNSIRKGFLNHTSEVYVVFSRTHKDSHFYAEILDKGLSKIKSNGQYQRIIDQWGYFKEQKD